MNKPLCQCNIGPLPTPPLVAGVGRDPVLRFLKWREGGPPYRGKGGYPQSQTCKGYHPHSINSGFMSCRCVPLQAERNGAGMQDMSLELIVSLHREVLADTQADLRIVSEGNLHQLVFQANLTDDPFSRAAKAFWSLCAYPSFRQGNRRTAHRLAEEILGSGGYRMTLPCTEIRELVQGIDAFTVETEDIECVFRSSAVPRS
jgi:prophage maintenance system killer protein